MSDLQGTQTCYNYDGQPEANNTQCPDSESCCATAKQCRPDRLCFSNESDKVIVRGPCANRPWSLSTCAQICLEERTGYQPRVNICPDGSYCCNDQKNCCANKLGYVLNEQGEHIGYANQTTPSLSSSTTTQTSTSTSSSSTTAEPSSGSNNLGVKVGVPVAVVAVLAIVAALWWFYRTRSARKQQAIPPWQLDALPSSQQQYQQQQYQQQQHQPVEYMQIAKSVSPHTPASNRPISELPEQQHQEPVEVGTLNNRFRI